MRRLSCAVSILILVVASTTAALAHAVYGRGTAWSDTNGNCLTADRVEVSHGGQNKGYSKVEAKALKRFTSPFGNIDCYQQWVIPSGDEAVKHYMLKWTGSEWAICKATNFPWKTNDADRFNLIQSKDYTAVPCGNGYYGTIGGVYFRGSWTGDLNGDGIYDWKGKWFSSKRGNDPGYHWLPA